MLDRRDLMAVNDTAAAMGARQSCHDIHCGRFAGPILADETVDLTALDLQADALKRVDLTKLLVKIIDFDYMIVH